jgi:hypothetical protein
LTAKTHCAELSKTKNSLTPESSTHRTEEAKEATRLWYPQPIEQVAKSYATCTAQTHESQDHNWLRGVGLDEEEHHVECEMKNVGASCDLYTWTL